jgi:hypothetical protein
VRIAADPRVPSVEATVADQASDAIGFGHSGVHIRQRFLVDEARSMPDFVLMTPARSAGNAAELFGPRR